MGIGITGMSKAELLPCPGDESCDPECIDEHLTVGTPGRGKDAVKLGCYVPGRRGRTFDLDFGYGGYSTWMRRLSFLALGVKPEEVWQRPSRFKGKTIRGADHVPGYRWRSSPVPSLRPSYIAISSHSHPRRGSIT